MGNLVERSNDRAEDKQGHFELIDVVEMKDIADKKVTSLPESDLCFQNEERLFQFKYHEPDTERVEMVRPGVWSLVGTPEGVKTKKMDVQDREILTSAVNSKKIIDESNTFFSNLEVYRELNEPEVRKILLYSDPGMGKSATIVKYCRDAIEEDPGTVILMWPTAEISSGDVSQFLSKGSEYTSECTRLIFVIEDIGGGERDGTNGTMAVDSSLINMLDGVEVAFKLPTLIIATTNYPQNLLSVLADRPGRFDMMMELMPPSYDERVELVEFIGKQKIDNEAKEALKRAKVETFSVAHLKEAVIRSRIHNKHLSTVIDEIIEHRDKVAKNFEKTREMGFMD